MPGQDLDPQDDRTDQDIRDGRIGNWPLLLLFSDHNLDHGQHQWQPNGGRNHHNEDHADDEKPAQLIRHTTDQCSQSIGAYHSQKNVGKQARQPELNHGEPAVGLG